MIKGFHHIALKTANAEKCLAFYKALGAQEQYHFTMPSGRTIYMIAFNPGHVIEVIPGLEGEPAPDAGWIHLAIDTDDCDAAFKVAMDAGAGVQMAPEDKQLGESGLFRIAYVIGPDGEIVEFFQKK